MNVAFTDVTAGGKYRTSGFLKFKKNVYYSISVPCKMLFILVTLGPKLNSTDTVTVDPIHNLMDISRITAKVKHGSKQCVRLVALWYT